MITTVPTPDLLAICDECVQPIADGQGNVWVDPQTADKAAQARASYDPRARPTATPPDAPWHTAHTACIDIPARAYSIAVERIRTWPGYLHWTVHLMSKDWLAGTDWEDFVMRSLRPQLAAVSGLRPIKPQSVHIGSVGD